MIDEGLADCAKNIQPIEFEISGGDRVKIFIESISIEKPQVPASCIMVRNKRINPSECRQRASTYSGVCSVGVGWSINGVPKPVIYKIMGEIPVMLKVSFAFKLQELIQIKIYIFLFSRKLAI